VLLAYVRKNRIRSGSIFCDKKNQPVERKEIWKKMKRVARLAGVPESKVFPHNLRHLFAKEFYRQTRDIIKLADVLGHTNVNTTRIYTRTTGREHKQQLDSMHMVIQGSVSLPKYEFYER
jgi:site-specific recombinase XerD